MPAVHLITMKRSRYLPVLLVLALFFGALPAAVQYLYEPASAADQSVQVTVPVVMYSTQWCPYCHRARAYFEQDAQNAWDWLRQRGLIAAQPAPAATTAHAGDCDRAF